jgi:hypothetical protein
MLVLPKRVIPDTTGGLRKSLGKKSNSPITRQAYSSSGSLERRPRGQSEYAILRLAKMTDILDHALAATSAAGSPSGQTKTVRYAASAETRLKGAGPSKRRSNIRLAMISLPR